MNRREAIAALMALPATTRISVAQLKPDDVVVFECDAAISRECCGQIKALADEVWPGRKVAILANGIKLKIVQG